MAVEIDAMVKAFQKMSDNMSSMERSSKTVAKNFSELMHQQQRHQRSLTEYLATHIKLPATMQEFSRSVITSRELLATGYQALKKDLAAAVASEKYFKEQRNAATVAGNAMLTAQHAEDRKAAKAQVKEFKQALPYLEEQIKLKQLAVKFTGEQRNAATVAGNAMLAAQHEEDRKAAKAQVKEFKQALSYLKEQIKLKQLTVKFTGDQLSTESLMLAAQHEEDRKAAKAQVKEFKQALSYLEEQIKLKQLTVKFTGEQLSIEYLMLRGFKDALERSGQLNQSLIEANSELSTRISLSDRVWAVSARTGTSMAGILEASKALVGVGGEMRGSFQDTLEVMVQMKDGLGVSYENSAQLARIFEVNLKSKTREVADQITIIKNNTSLAADEAARFATEIGKALRFTSATGGAAANVAGYVTLMAGKMKDVGGDSAEIVKMFTLMTKGTAEGAMLRGQAMARGPNMLSTEAGSRAVMQNIGRVIDTYVTVGKESDQYVFQLEAAAAMLQTNTETVLLWKDMIAEANKPLTANQKLQEAWHDQMKATNQGWNQIKESMVALVQRGFTPLLKFIQPVIQGVADFVKWAASAEETAYVAFAAVGLGTIVLARSLGSLAAQLYKTAVAAKISSGALKSKGQMDFLDVLLPGGGSTGKMSGALLSRLTPMLRGLVTSVGPTLAVAAAGAAGWAVGRVISNSWDKTFPNNWMKRLSTWTGESTALFMSKASAVAAPVDSGTGKLRWDELANTAIQMMMAGGTGESIKNYIKANVLDVSGVRTSDPSSVQRALRNISESMESAREQIDMGSNTFNEKEAIERDQQLLESSRNSVLTQQEQLDLMNKMATQRLKADQRRGHKEAVEEMLNKARQGLTPSVAPAYRTSPL